MWNFAVCHATLYWKSSLKVVQRRWYLTPSESKQNCCPLLKTFSNLQAASAGDTKAPGIWTASSRGEPCAFLGATASRLMLNPMARPPPKSRGPSFPEILSRNLPHCHGHFTACHSHESLPGNGIAQGKSSAVPCRTAALLLAGRLLQTWAKPSSAQGMRRGERAGALHRLF